VAKGSEEANRATATRRKTRKPLQAFSG